MNITESDLVEDWIGECVGHRAAPPVTLNKIADDVHLWQSMFGFPVEE